MNYEDRRLWSYGETLANEKRDLEYEVLKKQINHETVRAKDDILKPERIAMLEAAGRTAEAKYYRELARKKLSYDIYNALISGENPALMGTTFIANKAPAKVEELKNSLNDFNHSKKVLEEIDQRRAQIDEEIKKHVDEMNKQRTAAKMSEYKQPINKDESIGARKLYKRNIADHFKKK